MKLLRRRARPNLAPPAYGTPEFARWLNGPITRFCGHGYHEGGDKGPVVCEGYVETWPGITSPCECDCHFAGPTEGSTDG